MSGYEAVNEAFKFAEKQNNFRKIAMQKLVDRKDQQDVVIKKSTAKLSTSRKRSAA